jgi:hypothetical protein
MGIFNSNDRQGDRSHRTPGEQVKLTANLVASVWSVEGEDGEIRFNWDMSRLSNDGSRTFRTKRVENLLESVEFVGKLSEAFANSSSVPAELREELAAQAVALAECCEQLGRRRSEAKSNGQADANRVFGIAG